MNILVFVPNKHSSDVQNIFTPLNFEYKWRSHAPFIQMSYFQNIYVFHPTLEVYLCVFFDTRIGMQILTYEWKMFNEVQTLWHLTFHTNYLSVGITWMVWVSFSVKNIRVCLNLWTDITFSDEMKFFVLCQVFRHNSLQIYSASDQFVETKCVTV